MRRTWLLRGLKLALFVALAVAVAGAVVMSLWNWLTPAIFGWHAIGFWQALGLLALSRILIGGWRGSGHRMHWRSRMAERWERMTDEERARFREGLRHGRCGRGAAAPEAKV